MRYQITSYELLRQLAGAEPPPDDACIEWPRCRFSNGYGQVKHLGVKFGAHRLAYTLFIGPIPEGLWVCHRCDNKPCFRPSHLFLGTPSDNRVDCFDKGRAVTVRGADHGRSKITEADVLEIRRLCAAAEQSQSEIAERFAVSQSLVSLIHLRRKWPHLKP